jgi:putative CocE/NonD family hydrolase
MNNICDIQEIEDMEIILSDGCRLSARVWMPIDATEHPIPAILEYLPYRKRDGTCARDALTHPYFAKRGYACVRVDMRGNGDSQGLMEDEYTEQELKDGVEVIYWLANQDWCSGSVGMMGISWGGFNALQIAALDPAPLKAIITLCSTVDRYADDIHYKGGCLLNENLGWGSTMWAYSSRPPDPALVGENWREMWLERLNAQPFLPATWLRHQQRDAYWQHGSVCEDYSAITAATLAVGGWGDSYKNAVPQLVENLTSPVKGIVGPWVHKYPHFAVPEPRIGFLQEALRWWDKWLKGIETGVENDPAYSVYLMDGVRPKTWYNSRSGRWINEYDWPKGPVLKSMYLGRGNTLNSDPTRINDILSSPQTCGMSSGEYCAIWLGPEMPDDQRGDDAVSLCYDSEQMGEDCDIVGAAKVILRLKSDTPDGQVAVRLNHIHPDGASTRVTYGVLNLAQRDNHARANALPIGQEIEISFDLDHIAYRIPKGHKLRIAISNAYWPLLWPMPEASTLTISHGEVQLPISPHGADHERHFPPPDAEEPWDIKQIRASDNQRQVTTDMKSGITTLEIIDDFGAVEDQQHGMVSGSVAREWWSVHPDDPLSARGKTHWTEERSRGDWVTRTEAFAEMTSDAENFYLTARMEAYENDTLIFEKDFKETIKRKHH